jgi:hypothetical protein
MLLALAYFARRPAPVHPMQPRLYVYEGPSQRLTERGSPPGVCASCKIELADEDAAETEGGQRLHRGGCPIDEPARRRRKMNAAG